MHSIILLALLSYMIHVMSFFKQGMYTMGRTFARQKPEVATGIGSTFVKWSKRKGAKNAIKF